MNLITISTPPVSVNRLYQGRRFLTKEGKVTKESMAWEVKSQYRGKIIEGAVGITICFYFKDKRGMDIDGAIKGLLDCMTGIVWVDDRQITELHAYKKIDKKKPRIELVINTFSPVAA